MSQQLYTTAELQAMTPEEAREAQANGYVKPNPDHGPHYTPQWEQPDTPPTQPSAPQDPYAVTAWGQTEYDFRTPSGQLCRMKKLRPEELVGTDMLDRITRLPAFAAEEVRKAEGQPPTPALPSKEQLTQVTDVLNELIPMVVVKPTVVATPALASDREPGIIYVDDIELMDRIAIMERATQGVVKMDNFRQES